MKLSSRVALAATAAAVVVALAGCSSSAGNNPSTPTTGGTLSLGSVTDVTSFDPAQSHVGHLMPIFQTAYDSLILKSPDGELKPMLATKWDYNQSRTELTLTLRDGVVFTDGQVFDAAAVKSNIEHFKASNGPQASTAASIAEVKVIDDKTVKLILSAPDPALEGYLAASLGFMASPQAQAGKEIQSSPVGSGPYVLDKSQTVAGSVYTFKKNEKYWQPEIQKFDEIIFKPMADVTARLNALISGQIDAVLLDAKTGVQADNSGLELLTQATDFQGIFLFDRAGVQVPALKDVRVRQAMNYAIDRTSMLKAIVLDRGTATSQIAGESSVAFDESLEDYYAFDPKRAKELLADAGYADGFTLQMPTTPTFDPAVFSSVAQQLGDIGIRVQQVSVPAASYRNDIFAAKFPMAWFGVFQGDPWVAINHHIGPNSSFNPFKYVDDKAADLMSKVQAGDDNAAKELNKYITEQAWFVPVFRVDQNFYHDKDVSVTNQIQQSVPSIYNYSPVH